MAIDLTKLSMISKNNAFKNENNYTGSLVVPASISAGAIYTNTLTFTIPNGIEFMTSFGYFTNYSNRLFTGPSFTTYENKWYQITQCQDLYFISSAGVIQGQIIQKVTGNTIEITLRISRQGMSAVTMTHSGTIPISLVSYYL